MLGKERTAPEKCTQKPFNIRGAQISRSELIELSQYWAKLCGVYSITGGPLASWFEIHVEDNEAQHLIRLKEIVAYTQASSTHKPEILFRSEFSLQNTDSSSLFYFEGFKENSLGQENSALTGALLDIWLFCDGLRRECPVLIPVIATKGKLFKLSLFCYEHNCWNGHLMLQKRALKTSIS
ncbi:MAG: hypothetical protein CMK59_11030 [Proteobacteria bacterium]|nr:hypothetical protein [Pseudomonadota bacterium]